MNIVFSVFVFVLFFVLTPGVLLRLPSKGSKTMVALVHGLIFAIILAVSGHFFWKYKKTIFEGLKRKPVTKTSPADIKGDKGEKVEKSEKGEKGDTGPTGPTGYKGDP